MIPKIGQLLLANNLITEEQLQKAIELQGKGDGRIGSILVKLGFLTEEKLVSFLSKHFGVPAIVLSENKVDPSILKLIPRDTAQKYEILPVRRDGATLTIAMVDPSNIHAIDDVKFITGYNVKPVVAAESAIRKYIAEYYGKSDTPKTTMEGIKKTEEDFVGLLEKEEETEVRELRAVVEEAPIVRLVNQVLSEAIAKGASDIHIEPYEKTLRIRYRIDGMLYDVMQQPLHLTAPISSRIKILANLDIAERRLPQDGRIELKMKDMEFDLRVSTLPTIFGEKVVMRILDRSGLVLDLTKLGFEEKALRDFNEAIHAPYGMLLVTGPTGSGKTTTLYSALSTINEVGVNIMTAEDPVEYHLAGINQLQVKEEIGLTFATALRSFLRQDPDIILVGEIRDFETAEIAIKAVFTGHLVLSTLHTNDAPSSILRLLNMGIEPFLVAESIRLIVAQRLVRKICQKCKEEERVPLRALVDVGFPIEEAKTVKCFRGKGCPACNGIGYRGRIAIFEVMTVTNELRELILQGAPASEIKKAAIRSGMKTLRMAGLTKVKEGITSIEEVLRVTVKD